MIISKTFRPIGNGNLNQFPTIFPNGGESHWEDVDEEVANDDTDYVEHDYAGTKKYELFVPDYSLLSTIPDAAVINSVKVIARAKTYHYHYGETPYVVTGLMIKKDGESVSEYNLSAVNGISDDTTDGTYYDGISYQWNDTFLIPGYPNYAAWTKAMLADLQFGVYSSWWGLSRVTQVYLVITYTLSPPSPPSIKAGLYGKQWVWVDWNDDGDFSDTYDDITTDVKSIPIIRYGIDRELDEATSAVMELQVRNKDYKYSPPNTSSVLNIGGNTLRSGHRIMAGISFPFDNFTDTDGIEIDNHFIPHDSSFTWSEESGTFVIDTNAIKETGGSGGIAVIDFEESDAHVAVKFTKGADDDCILVLRYSDTDNYIYIKTTATDLELRKVVAGADSLIDGETFAWTVGDAKTVKAVLHGEYIWVIVDLVQVIPLVRRTSGALTNDSFNKTETKHGIGGPSIHTDARYDDFGGVYSLFYGTIDRIIPLPITQTATITASDDMKIMAQTKLFRRAYAYAGYPAGMKAYAEQITANIPSLPQLGELYDWGQNTNNNPYKSWWDISALDVWRKIEREENGLAYQDQDGIWRFEGRTHRSSSPHDVAKCIFYDTYDTNNLGFIDLKWISGEDDVKNYITITIQKSGKVVYSPVEVWRCKEADVVDGGILSSELVIPANNSVILFIESKDFDTIDTLIAPTTNPNCYRLTGTITGKFILGETVWGNTSGDIGVIIEIGGNYLILDQTSGAFNANDTVTGGASGATLSAPTGYYRIIGTITGGPFDLQEKVTTNISGGYGFNQVIAPTYILLNNCQGTPFNAGDTFTGVSSGALLNGSPTIQALGTVQIEQYGDYIANAAANGSGADMTSDLSIALAYPFYGSYGKGAKVTLTNTDLTDPLYVTRLKIRGDGYLLQPRITALAEDTTSQGNYGMHTHNIDADLLLTLTEAQALADDIEGKEDDPKATLQIELANATKETLTKILSLRISDRITINYTDMGIDKDFYINKIEYSISDGGLVVRAVLTLEEVA